MHRLAKINLVLGGSALVMGAALTQSMTTARPVLSIQPVPAGPGPAEPRRLLLETPGIEAYDTIAARPIFAPDRRPPAPELAAPEPAPAAVLRPPPPVVLTGVTTLGQERRALLQVGTGPQQLYRVGQPVAGWRIVSIESEQVILQYGNARHVAKLGATPPDAREGAGQQGSPRGRGASRRRAARGSASAEATSAPAPSDMADMADLID